MNADKRGLKTRGFIAVDPRLSAAITALKTHFGPRMDSDNSFVV
jgi:hypothetical protein